MNAMISGLRPYLVGVTLSCVLCQPVHGKKVNQTQSRAEPGGRPSQEEKAKQLLTQGSSELDRRELSSAYKTLSAAYSGFPNTEGLYQLCRLAIAEGNAVAARDLCRRYLADPGHAEESTVPHQKELLDALGKTIPPSGEVAVFGSLGALVFLDDRLVGSLPLSRPLLAPVGQHRVALVDSGHRQEWPVKVLADRTVEMRFEPESSAVLVTQLPAVLLLFRTEKLPEALRIRMQQTIEQSVVSAHFATQKDSADSDKSKASDACMIDYECMRDLAKKNNADYIIIARVSSFNEVNNNRISAQIDLSFAEIRANAKLLSNDHVCSGCTIGQFSNSTSEAVRSLISIGTARSRGDLSISVNPKSAQLTLDGAIVGTGRYENSIPASVYAVEAAQQGFISQRSTIVVEPGKNSFYQMTLLPKVPAYKTDRAPRQRWRLATGVTVATLGLVLVGYGLSGVAIAGSCADQGPSGVCRQIFDSKGTGIAFSTIGATLTLGGILLMSIPSGYRNIEIPTDGFGDPVNE